MCNMNSTEHIWVRHVTRVNFNPGGLREIPSIEGGGCGGVSGQMVCMGILINIVITIDCAPVFICVKFSWFTRVPWLIHMWDIPHAHVLCRSHITIDPAPVFIWVTLLIHTCDMPLSSVSCAEFMRVLCLIQMCDVTHSHVRRDSFICVIWLSVVCQLHTSDMSYSYECVISLCVTYVLYD